MSHEASEKGRNEILRYIDAHGVHDKDRGRGARAERRHTALSKTKTGQRLTVDLHRKTEAEAERILAKSVQRCRRDGFGELLIIHGKGLHSPAGETPSLKNLTRRMLDHELRHAIRDYRGAAERDGSDGATLVFF